MTVLLPRMISDRRVPTNFDWRLVAATSAILLIGLVSLYSVAGGGTTPIYQRQFYWMLLGWAAFGLMTVVDYRVLARYAYVGYGVVMFLLMLVLVTGRSSQGAQRWLSVGGLSIQPSELAKLAVLFVLASYFAERRVVGGYRIAQLAVPMLLVLAPLVLVMKQPDLGTALTLLFLFLAMVAVVGIRSRTLVVGALLFVMLFPFLWQGVWHSLKDYQRARLVTFLDPSADPLGKSYHLMQSKIAIGSGGWFGKGFQEGTQSQLKFLPEAHTDFVFSVLAEEWGFIGAIVVIGLYLTVLLLGMDAAIRARDMLGSLLAVGVVAMIGFNLIINVAMTSGLLPVVGIPLPLMSYGGTAMVVTMTGLGVVMNVRIRRLLLFH
ncbi:MAG TPA: rod shape-determining protein RodA [Nitrospiria bacterium]|nr:rod shape-determining protein RodA [Nitrospiria bacterium]